MPTTRFYHEPPAASNRRWQEVRRGHPCPVCGRHDRCKVAPDGSRAWCLRVESATPDKSRVGWLHVIDGVPRPRPVVPPRVEEQPDRADDDVLAVVYPALLAALPLHRRHRDDLRRRGLNDEVIVEAGYATLPDDPPLRWRVAGELLDRFGADLLRVPGFVARKSRAGKPYVTVVGPPGLLIPCRDQAGRPLAIKVRRDQPGPGGKYLLLSRMGGPGNDARVHVPLGTPTRCDRVVVVEGELKADVARHLTGWAVVSVPGVDVWRPALPVLESLGAREVLAAYDADLATNSNVLRALRLFLVGLVAAGYRHGGLSWDAAHGKGLDDALASAGPACVFETVATAEGVETRPMIGEAVR